MIRWHAVVEGNHLEAAISGHQRGLFCPGFARIVDVAAAVQVHEQAVAVGGWHHLRRQNESVHSADYGRLHRHA